VSGQHSADSIEYSPDIGQEGDSVTIVVGLVGVETTVEDSADEGWSHCVIGCHTCSAVGD
jgi:hypothetical protein